MFENPLVVGVKQVGAELEEMRVEDALMALGRNTGNMMFTQSLTTIINNATPGGYDISGETAGCHDVLVLAAANWVNSFDDFGWLAERIEAANLPVVVAGIGAQASEQMERPILKPGTARFLDVIRERSISISVRGKFSAQVLSDFGLQNVRLTGCPSLLLIGSNAPRLKAHVAVDRGGIVLHGTRHNFYKSDSEQARIYRAAIEHQYDILLQSENADIYLALRRHGNQEIYERAIEAAQVNYGTSEDGAISYLTEHGKVFFSYRPWIDYMKTRHLCVGSRIHGTISALIANIPAVLLSHDSRTLEMAEAMNIPFASLDNFKDFSPEGLRRLADEADFPSFTAGYAAYRTRFLEFFEENKLGISLVERDEDMAIH